MQKVVMFGEAELEALKQDIINEIIKESKKGYGIQFIERESGYIAGDTAMYGWLTFCIDRVWPK